MAEKNSNGFSYFKSKAIPGLSIITGEPEDGQVAPQSVRFEAYDIKTDLGETLTVGFLKTDDATAIEIARADQNVEEIDEAQFKKYTTVDGEKIKRARI